MKEHEESYVKFPRQRPRTHKNSVRHSKERHTVNTQQSTNLQPHNTTFTQNKEHRFNQGVNKSAQSAVNIFDLTNINNEYGMGNNNEVGNNNGSKRSQISPNKSTFLTEKKYYNMSVEDRQNMYRLKSAKIERKLEKESKIK